MLDPRQPRHRQRPQVCPLGGGQRRDRQTVGARRHDLGHGQTPDRRPLGQRLFPVAAGRDRQRQRRQRPAALDLVAHLDQPGLGQTRQRAARAGHQPEETRQRKLAAGVRQRAQHRIARRVRDQGSLPIERPPAEVGQPDRALGARLLPLRQRRAQHLAERRLIVVGGPAAEGDHRLVEGRLAPHHLFDVARREVGLAPRRRVPDDEAGHGARAERHHHLRAYRRRARTRIAVGEGPRHRQRHRHLEQRARDFGVRHFRSSFSIPARTSSRMSSRLSA